MLQGCFAKSYKDSYFCGRCSLKSLLIALLMYTTQLCLCFLFIRKKLVVFFELLIFQLLASVSLVNLVNIISKDRYEATRDQF